MSAVEVLARLHDAGAEVFLRDGQAIVRMHRPLNPELLAEARAAKAELVELLAASAAEHARMVADLMKVAAMRSPRFSSPSRWWSANRTAWCTGCGKPSTWRADPPPAPNPSVLHWRCTRCCPQPAQEKASAS